MLDNQLKAVWGCVCVQLASSSPDLFLFLLLYSCIAFLTWNKTLQNCWWPEKNSLAKNLLSASFNLTAWACCHYYSPTSCSPFLRGVRRHCAYRLPYRSPFEKSATFHPGVFLVDSTARAKGPLLSSLFPNLGQLAALANLLAKRPWVLQKELEPPFTVPRNNYILQMLMPFWWASLYHNCIID